MRTMSTGIRLCALLLAGLTAADAVWACGDKYIVGDTVTSRDQVQNSPMRGNVILFSRASVSALEQLDLVGALRESGLEVTFATDENQLATALTSAHVDLVLAGYDDALKIDTAVRGQSPTSRIVPILTREQRSKMTEAKQAFVHVLNIPAKLSRILAVIRGALQSS